MRSKAVSGAVKAFRPHAEAFRAHYNPFPPSRRICVSPSLSATTLPITVKGAPPAPPSPAKSAYLEKLDHQRRKAELLKQGKDLRQQSKGGPLKRRFWKEVRVEETPDGYRILLDKRPVRSPNKEIITIPLSKPQLAHAMAIEWDMLGSAQEATKNHRIPLTSIVSRAGDIKDADMAGNERVREEILTTLMRYLDTDTLLCWAPERDIDPSVGMERDGHGGRQRSLRELQIETAKPIMAYLSTHLWPGVEIRPVLDEGSIMPLQQSEVTKSVVSGWVSGLPVYELAALERAVLAGKSLLVGARLLVEWSEEFRDLQRDNERKFGIEQAAEATNLEVKWQTGMWGEVEDTHDVDNEDIRRQLGSAVLLVSGNR